MTRNIGTLRLNPDGLIEAIAEIRFSSHDLADIIPAKLSQSSIFEDFKTERLPAADLPLPMRQINPQLAYLPILQQVSPSGQRIAKLGEQVFSWHSLGAYPGWSVFQPEVANAIKYVESALRGLKFERIALRYINAFDPIQHGVTSLNDLALDISISGHPLDVGFNLNYTRLAPAMEAKVKIATKDYVIAADGSSPSFSLLMDIDVSTSSDFKCDGSNQLLDWLENAHMCLKTEFFGIIPDHILEKLAVG